MARRLAPLWYGLLALGVAIAASVDAAPAEADGRDRVVRAAAGYAHEREPGTLREIESLREERTASADVVTKPREATGRTSRTASEYVLDHWIYDAAAEIYFDADGDGYYRYLRLRFDVDSYYDNAWIFARLYLSDDGEHWEMFYETDDFRVDGAWPDDEYEVETELVVSYPPGLYDVLIEIYDADTLEFQDEFGPAESSAFALLPLEDASYDGVPPPVVVVSEGGGGAVSIGALLLLALGAAAARRARARTRAPKSMT